MQTSLNIKQILAPRLPPYLWDMIGYCGGLLSLFYYDQRIIFIYACLFVFYGLTNIFFDYVTVGIEYSNSSFPQFNDLNEYRHYVYNKKYKILYQDISNRFNDTQRNIINMSHLSLELNLYLGNSKLITSILMSIYLLGITKKNYTNCKLDEFRQFEFVFV